VLVHKTLELVYAEEGGVREADFHAILVFRKSQVIYEALDEREPPALAAY